MSQKLASLDCEGLGRRFRRSLPVQPGILVLLLLVLIQIQGAVAEPLRIVSYNIKHGLGMDGKIDLERIARVIAAEKPDIVTLQEVDQGCARSGSVDQAAQLGKLLKMTPHFGKFMDFQGGEYGMAVLSRLPVEKTVVHRLPDGAEPRIALEVQVKSPRWPGRFSVVGIHHDWTDEEIRVRQVKALLEALADRKTPVILAGDFNTEPGEASLALLDDAGWQTLRKTPTKTCPSVEPTMEIDFFIARGLPSFTYEEKVIPEKLASDHRPISLQLFSVEK
jgi:endonuclease/exonuclease/phosphatase family metal-dependent hydrolase